MPQTCCFSHGLFPYTLIIRGFGQAASCEDVCLEGPALQRGLGNAPVLQAENRHPALSEKSWALEVHGQTGKGSLLRHLTHGLQRWQCRVSENSLGFQAKIDVTTEIQAIINGSRW